QRERRFLVRHRDIGAHITARRKCAHELGKLVRRHRLAPVFAGDAVALEPIIMDERRARMRNRPANHTRGARPRVHASSATALRSRPMSGHSTSMVSPGLSQTGGSALTFLIGVPVQMTSPGLSVMNVVV